MGKVLVQCGALEEPRLDPPGTPRSSPPSLLPTEDTKPCSATDGAKGKAPGEGAAPAAGAQGADSGAAAQAAPEPNTAPAEVRAKTSGRCSAAGSVSCEALLCGALGLVHVCKKRLGTHGDAP